MDLFDRLCGKATGPVGVAVSGGSDSLALLILAHEWAEQSGRALVAFTVDHRLRPEAADEARAVAEICAGLNVPHQTLVWRTPKGKQALARRARHAMMAEALRAEGGTHLLLGHTADDQVETFLMRARQGSTWYGLAGMQPIALSPVWPEGQGVRIARPVLKRSRADLREELERRGVDWIDDPSNRNPAYERVRVRTLLAGQERLKTRILACQARLQDLRRLEERLIAHWMREQVSIDGEGVFQLDLSGLPEERLIRALGVMLQIVGGRETPPRKDAVEPLAMRLTSDKPFSGATLGGVMIYRNRDHVSLAPEPEVSGDAAEEKLARARFAAIRSLYGAGT